MDPARPPDRPLVRGGDPALPLGEQDSAAVTLAQVMLPQDANPSGNVHGGSLMKLADTAGGVCAIRHARQRVVTVVMDSMTFEQPAFVGDLITACARLTWVGRSSMETEVSIEAENVLRGERRHVSTGYFVYVALDSAGRPTAVPPMQLSGPAALADWEAAEQRHNHRVGR